MGRVRTCIGCRVRAPWDQLLRVVQVSGRLQLDWSRSLPGRGAWLHPVDVCVARALDRNQFRRALRANVTDDTAVRAYLLELSAKAVDRTMDQ